MLLRNQFEFGVARAAKARGLLYAMAAALWMLVALGSGGARAEAGPSGAPADAPALLEEARKDVDAVRAAPREGLSDAELGGLRARALGAQAKADRAEASLAPELADVSARLSELGPVAAGTAEAPDVAAQRRTLAKAQAELDSQVKLARLLSLEAEQAAKSAVAQRRQQFGARLTERAPAPLSSGLWRDLRGSWPTDAARLRQFGGEVMAGIGAMTALAWMGVCVLVGSIVLGHVALRRLLVRIASSRIPSGRLRRSAHALGVVVLWVLTAGLIAHVLSVGLDTAESASPETLARVAALEGILWFAGFTYGLGVALLMPGKPSWRLAAVPDEAASRLGWFPLTLTLAVTLGWSLSRVAQAIDASLAMTVALNALIALSYLLIGIAGLLQLGQAYRHESRPDGDQREAGAPLGGKAVTPVWVAVLRTAAWVFLVVTLIALLSGYIAFSTFMAGQLVWFLVIGGAAYLLAVLIDDLCSALLAGGPAGKVDGDRGGGGGAATGSQGDLARVARARAQAAVLISAIARVGIYFLALLLVLAPYGEGPLELLQRAGHVNDGLSIGEVSLKPGAMVQAALLLIVGLAGVRVFKRWLADKYMPTTQMDAGMRMSIITLSGYAGTVVIIAMAISAVGMGLERVTWVASALSVGIGFGLQAIVQNFVSGLILLAERPVKVGDWVSLSGVEGDIRRINVRATEIQMGDRSTVIIPNSEFITKVVRNVTYGDNIGLVQIKLPLPLSTNTVAARDALMAALTNHGAVLSSPGPTVQLEGITDARLVFVITGFVSSPRMAGGVKSDLLFDIFERLRAAGITLEQPAALVVAPTQASEPGPGQGSVVKAAGRPGGGQ